jgi:hypothetical protein
MTRVFLLALCLSIVPDARAQANHDQGRVVESGLAILPLRERPAVENRILTERLDKLLPRLMEETAVGMWLVLAREYAEDPVYFSLVPQPTFAARRTTMLVFNRGKDGFEKLTVNRYPLGDPYESAWSGGELDAQWAALGELIASRNPASIGINVSRDWPVADGLTHGLHRRLLEVLPKGYERRLKSSQQLIVRWMETRLDSELTLYPHIVSLARQVIGEAFSNRVITPGVTTTDDVAWFIRQRFSDLNLPTWFMPYVNAQRPDLACEADAPFCGTTGTIMPGDVLHTDVGICYLKLCTDTQEMGYVTRIGETTVPNGLVAALASGNRWQDELTESFEAGRTGNEILAATIGKSERRAAISTTYTHPVGFFGHAPGPTIGMWDNQGQTPVSGDWPLHPMTAYAIEGNIKAPVPEWEGQLVQIKLEQTAIYDGTQVLYAAGRQTRWHLIQ